MFWNTGGLNKESPSPPYADIIAFVNMCVHIQSKQNFTVCVPIYLWNVSIDVCVPTCYNITIKRNTEQPESPKGPDTPNHIPVSEPMQNQ